MSKILLLVAVVLTANLKDYQTSVSGFVGCESFEGRWRKDLTDAIVTVQCKDDVAQSMTSQRGYFHIEFPSNFTNEDCRVKSISSADKLCTFANSIANEKWLDVCTRKENILLCKISDDDELSLRLIPIPVTNTSVGFF